MGKAKKNQKAPSRKRRKKTVNDGPGRPRKFKTVEELEKAINQYFKKEKDKLTITGLALHIGFSSRADLIRNEGFGPEYHYALKKAKLRVENAYEKKLHGNAASGAIFALKNFDWRDKQEIDHTTGGDKIQITLSQKK